MPVAERLSDALQTAPTCLSMPANKARSSASGDWDRTLSTASAYGSSAERARTWALVSVDTPLTLRPQPLVERHREGAASMSPGYGRIELQEGSLIMLRGIVSRIAGRGAGRRRPPGGPRGPVPRSRGGAQDQTIGRGVRALLRRLR